MENLYPHEHLVQQYGMLCTNRIAEKELVSAGHASLDKHPTGLTV